MPTGVSKAFEYENAPAGTKRVSVQESDAAYINRPNIDGCKFFVNGEIREWTGAVQIVESPVFLGDTDQKARKKPPSEFCKIPSPYSKSIGCWDRL